MTLFRLDASIRNDGSHSREIADLVEAGWQAAHPNEEVRRRHIGTEPLPSTAWGLAALARFTPESERTQQQREAQRLAARLADELVAADALLFAVPLYNFGVSQHFKTYVDLIITDPRFAAGQTLPVAGRPAELVITRGGSYVKGAPREGWDHATGWMRRILSDVWQLCLTVVEVEFTLVGVNPDLDRFAHLAAERRAKAEELAREHGRKLGTQLTGNTAT